MHTLDGTYLRKDRANKHLADLKLFIEGMEKRNYKAIFGRKRYTKSGHVDPSQFPDVVVPPEISVFVGEIVYNLRASLDYLVYELARNDSGTYQDGTQFPIEDKGKGFDAKVSQLLKGVSSGHVGAIKLLQPSEGCKWTGILRDISNPDKHRKLTVFRHVGSIGTRVVLPSDWRTKPLPSNREMKMERFMKFYPSLPDGTRIVEALDNILVSVTQVLDQFKPEFK